MPKLDGGKIWLTSSELVEYDISEQYIRISLNRNRKFNTSSWQHKPHPEDRRVKLINFDSIPDTTQQKLPTRQELIEITKIQHSECQDYAADMITKAHSDCLRIEDGHYLRETEASLGVDQVNDLMMAAAWLRLLSLYKSKNDTITLGVPNKKRLREIVIQLILEQDMQRRRQLYGFKVSNVTVLQRKELKWSNTYKEAFEQHSNLPKTQAEKLANQAALTTLLHSNFGNNNRRIVGSLNPDPDKRILTSSGRIDLGEWHARKILYYCMNPGSGGKFDFEEIHWRYSKDARNEGKKPVSLSEVKHFLNLQEVKLVWLREREGYKSFDKMLSQANREKPSHSLLKGGFDGFDVDFQARTEMGILMLRVVAIWDYHSEAITGLSIGYPREAENGRMVRDMYLNHLNTNEGLSYIEVECDRAAFNTSPETKAIFDKAVKYFTQPKPQDQRHGSSNPKARTCERYLQEVNRLIQKGDVKGWKGTNITSIDKKRKPNEDYKLEPIGSYEEAVMQIIDLISVYNNQKLKKYNGKSRMEVYQENKHPEAIHIPVLEKALLLHQSKEETIRGGLITVTINKRKHEYRFPEYIDNIHLLLKGNKVKVYYREEDMSTVDIFGVNDIHLATLGKMRRVAGDKYTQNQDPEQQKLLGKMANERIQQVTKLDRKSLEAEAAYYGEILPVHISIDDAWQMVKGWRSMYKEVEEFPERFSEELATVNARQTRNYYSDATLRDEGYKVPVTVDNKSLEEKRREHLRKKFKK